MARIREAQIGDDGDIRIVRDKGGGWRLILGLALIIGGVWLFDATYGDGRAEAPAAYERSDAEPN